MPDFLSQALSVEGLGWVFIAAFVAGLVRGFSGFGTALVYMPIAAQVLPPVWAVLTIAMMDLVGPIPNIPAAIRQARLRDIGLLVLGTVLALPLGLWALGQVDVALFQVAVSGIALLMLAILMTGLRYRGPVGRGLIFGTGCLAGGCGGLTGVPGPPVILLYMAVPNPAAIVRASTMLYLYAYDLLLVAGLLVMGLFTPVPAVIGAMLVLPNLIGNVLGAALFRPELEPVYRRVAYGIIAASAIAGLPFWELGG